MVHIGIIGIGFMGMTHYRGARRVKGGKVTAICTRDEKKLRGDWRGIHGNFGEPGGIEDLSGIRTYRKVDDLLADPEIDLVNICLPSAMHRDVTIAALRAGKHVLLEKPIALKPKDADRMVQEAGNYGRSLMVAQVLPFFPEFAYARKGRGGRGSTASFWARTSSGLFRSPTGLPNLETSNEAADRVLTCTSTIPTTFFCCAASPTRYLQPAASLTIITPNICARATGTTTDRALSITCASGRDFAARPRVCPRFRNLP